MIITTKKWNHDQRRQYNAVGPAGQLGTQLLWDISKVDLDMSAHQVDIEIEI